MVKLILLVDDDPEEQEIMNEALRAGNIEASCVWANGPEHATRMLVQLVPDYIFIDLNMPAINGLKFLESIGHREELREVRKVIYSTHIDEETEVQAKLHGAVCCIRKPAQVSLLINQLNRIMAMHGSFS